MQKLVAMTKLLQKLDIKDIMGLENRQVTQKVSIFIINSVPELHGTTHLKRERVYRENASFRNIFYEQNKFQVLMISSTKQPSLKVETITRKGTNPK